jgi:hypothetical protein
MNEIFRGMKQLVETIDRVSTFASEDQRLWAMFWRRSLSMAINKAIQSRWVAEGDL